MLEIGAIISTEPQNDFKAQASIFKPPCLFFFVKFAHKPENLPDYEQVSQVCLKITQISL